MPAKLTLYQNSLNYINTVCNNYVGENVAAVAQVLGPFAFTMLSLYVALWGFAHWRGMIQQPAIDFINRVVVISIVFGIGFTLANYNVLITNTFLRGPDEFIGRLAKSPGSTGVVSGLDEMLEQGFAVGLRFWAKAGVLEGDFGMYFVALFVWALSIMVTAYGFFLMALSKVMMTVVIGLGPLFFIGLLFQATAGFFNSWLRQLANYFLVPVLVVMVNLLLMKLFSNAASGALAITNATEVAQVFPFFAMGLVSLLALASVLSVAAGLAGGVSLSSFGMGRLTGGLLKSAGFKISTGVGGTAGRWTGTQGAKIGRSAWKAYQNRKRNTIRPSKSSNRPLPLPYGQSRPTKARAKAIALPYNP